VIAVVIVLNTTSLFTEVGFHEQPVGAFVNDAAKNMPPRRSANSMQSRSVVWVTQSEDVWITTGWLGEGGSRGGGGVGGGDAMPQRQVA